MDKKEALKRRLAELSPEEKRLLFDVLEEKKLRLKERRPVYSPNEGQRPVHVSQKWLRGVFAGNGGGKSSLATNEAIWAMRGYNPVADTFTKVPARVIAVLDDPYKSDSQWIPEIEKWAVLREDQKHKQGKPYTSQITQDNGSELIFMSHDQSPMKFESLEADVIIFDEPPPRHIYVALVRSLRKKGRKPRLLIVGTPIVGGWMRRELLEPWERGERPDIDCFVFSTKVNEANLEEEYIKRMKATLTEKEQQVRLGGKFADVEGLALAHLFDESTHVIDMPDDWDSSNPCVMAIDPHPSKAHYAVLLGCDEKNYLYYLAEFKLKAPAREFMQRLIEEEAWFSQFKIIDIIYDSLGNADTTGGEGYRKFGEVINEVLTEHCLPRARATTFKEKSDEDFIERIRDVLLVPDMPDEDGEIRPKLQFIRGKSVGCLQDIRNVSWAQYAKNRNIDESKPKLDITQKDFLSATKYALATNLYYRKAKDSRGYRPVRGPSTYGAARPRRAKTLQLRWGRRKRD